jgi:hypothetical protein
MNVQRAIDPLYQIAMKSSESSAQLNAYAVAPNAPATSPAIAPVQIKLVGAPWRNALMSAANGITAKSGMHRRQVCHRIPIIILVHDSISRSRRPFVSHVPGNDNLLVPTTDRGLT